MAVAFMAFIDLNLTWKSSVWRQEKSHRFEVFGRMWVCAPESLDSALNYYDLLE
jgi:hypothetical protein